MPKYVIERQLAGIGNITPDQVLAISRRSCRVLESPARKFQWFHSFVTADKIYCRHIAPNEEKFVAMPGMGGRANRISEVKLMIDPTSTEIRF